MPDSGAVRAGKAYIELGMDDAPLKAQMQQAEKSMGDFAEALKTAAAAVGFAVIADKIVGWVTDFADAGKELYESSQKAGMSLADLGEKAANSGFGNFDGLAMAYELADAFDRMKKSGQEMYKAVASALAPAFKPFLEIMIASQKAVNKFITENKTLVQIAGAVVGVGAAIAAGFTGAATAIYVAKTAFGALLDAVTSVTGVLSGVVSGIGAIFSPIGLAIAGIVAAVGTLGVLFVTQTNIGRNAFASLTDTIKRTWGGVVDAFMAGELELAFQIACAGLRVIWEDFKDWWTGTFPAMSAAFRTFADGIVDIWTRAYRGMGLIGAWAMEQIGAVPAGTANEMARGFDREDRPQPPAPAARDELNALRAEAARRRAAAEEKRRQNYLDGITANASEGARGTFNSAAAFGLVGAGNPVVRQLETLNSQTRTVIARLDDVLARQAVFI